MMAYVGYKLPMYERELNENIVIHLLKGQFEWQRKTYPFRNIIQIRPNLFWIEGGRGPYECCFRPKWYQLLKLYAYFFYKKIIGKTA